MKLSHKVRLSSTTRMLMKLNNRKASRQPLDTIIKKMSRKATLRLLYAISGNKCAFPNCDHSIFNDEGLYIAQLCHIKGANIGGQRYDNNQSDEERRSYDNLLFMCHRHHKETDNEDRYDVEKLIEIKVNHEANFLEKGRKLFYKFYMKQIIFGIDNQRKYMIIHIMKNTNPTKKA